MTFKPKQPVFVEGHGFTKADWDAVGSAAATKAQMAKAKLFAEAFPELADKMRKSLGGRPPVARSKEAVSLRLDQDVIDKFISTSPGWQSRINDVLKRTAV